MLTKNLKSGMIIMVDSTKACWLVLKILKRSSGFVIVWLSPYGVIEKELTLTVNLLDCQEVSS
jgi:hypothetical protein